MVTSNRLRRWWSLVLLVAAAALVACGAAASGPGSDLAPGTAAADEAAPLRVMSFNVRYGTAQDGDNAWPLRRDLVLEVIEDYDPAILGVQEALRFQLDEIRSAFAEPGEVGVGREDGAEAGEYSAILYDRRRLTLLDQGTSWLSDTPDVPGSTSWGNRIPRIVTWARFRDAAGGAPFVVLNTHWDHESQRSREFSSRYVQYWMALHARRDPVILTGDFNAGEQNPAFRGLLPFREDSPGLLDTFRAVHPGALDVGTYHAFTGDTRGEKIDAVLASRHWTVVDAAIVRTARDGRYPSDHFPVTATLLRAADGTPDP